MISVSIANYPVFIAFWLSFTRWVAILFQIPVFDNTSIPGVVKILTALIISYAFFPIVEQKLVSEVLMVGVDNFWYLTIFHTVVGLFIGFLVKSIMSIFIATGNVMTQQIGFTSVSYFDPTFESRVGPFERLIQWTIIIMILTTGALIPMFKGVLNSFFSVSISDLGSFASIHIFYEIFRTILIIRSTGTLNKSFICNTIICSFRETRICFIELTTLHIVSINTSNTFLNTFTCFWTPRKSLRTLSFR